MKLHVIQSLLACSFREFTTAADCSSNSSSRLSIRGAVDAAEELSEHLATDEAS